MEKFWESKALIFSSGKADVSKKIFRMLRLTFFCFFLGLAQVIALNTYSQTRLSIKLQDQRLEDVLQAIENQSAYFFMYNKDLINVEQKVNIEASNQTIQTVLDKLFKGTDINYSIVNRQIILSNLRNQQIPAGQQQKTVSGKVTDSSGGTLPGVSVAVKGTTIGTITDMDGKYTLQRVPENAVLQFSFVGMKAQEVSAAGKTEIDVALQEESVSLEEVVAVGYGTQKKVNLTGSITNIKTDELTNIAIPNLSNTLAGRAPGVNITGNSGLIGSSSSIRIRGSFGEPLYVIDGIIRDKTAFDALEANEIDQMSFLKDAATASVYGSKAGNGVILVTTKSGKVQKPVFNYQGSYTFMTPTMTLLADKTTAIDELIYQNNVAEFLKLSKPNGDKEFAYFKDKNYNVNDYVWQTPWNTKHSINVSGGSEKLTYYTLVSYIGEQGSYKNLDNDKFNIRSNVTAQITDRIKLNMNLSAWQKNGNRFYWPFTDDDDFAIEDLYRCTFNWPKTYPFYLNKDGSPANGPTDYPVQTPMGSWNAWNVVDQVIGNRYIKTREREMDAIMALDVDLGMWVKGLSTKFVANYIGKDYTRKKYLTYQKNYAWVPLAGAETRFVPSPPDPNKINVFTFSQNQEFLSYNLKTLWSEQLNWFLNYSNRFNKHEINGSVIWEQASKGGEIALAKMEQPLTAFDQSFVYSSDTQRRWGEASEETGGRLSWIGRFNYNYDQRYITEFSFRYDGNTLFPKHKRWGFFPSFSLAWRIGSEAFMESSKSWLDDLKIRFSYGTTGNDLNTDDKEITPFSYMYTYKSGTNYIFGNDYSLGIRPGDTPNPNLTWATSTTYNSGIDFTVLNSRLSGSFEVYLKKETDILGSRLVKIPDTYGQSLAPENYAARSWRGLEFNALWRDKAAGGKIDYTIYGNIGFSRDRWDVLDEPEAYRPGGNQEWRSNIGKPINRIFGLKTLKMLRSQQEVDVLKAKGFKQFGRDPYLGGLIFEDIRGDGYKAGPDGKIDDNDIQLLSNDGAPRINYGFGGAITWKSFTIDLHFQGVGLYDKMISNKEGSGIRQHGGPIRPYYPLWAGDVFTPSNPDGKYPRPVGNNWYESGTGDQSFWIRNGAYLRLKNLNIAYNLPRSLTSRLGIMNAQVFFNGNNLFVLSPVTEFQDPEQKTYDSYPLMRSYTFGIDIKF